MTDEEKQEMVELEKKIDTALNEFNLWYAQRLLNRLNELKSKQSKEKSE